MNIIQKINPINKEEEKRKFLFDPLYNPQFEYEQEVTPEEYVKYGPISDQYLAEAQYIIDLVVKKYKTKINFVEETEGELLTKDEVEQGFRDYVAQLDLGLNLTLDFSSKYISRTTVEGELVRIRLPISYRKKSFNGVLNHEIGTHLLRNVNEKESPWTGKRREFQLSSFSETEEGLATIHQYLDRDEPYFFDAALNYVATQYAATHSFAELFKKFHPYLGDVERSWAFCLRIKRGMKDTSMPGAFSRNQMYLSGFIKVLGWLEKNGYNPANLYRGKLSIEDLPTALKADSRSVLKLPVFLRAENLEAYKKSVINIKKKNFPHL